MLWGNGQNQFGGLGGLGGFSSSFDQMQNKRQQANGIARGTLGRPARNFGEGLGAIGQALMYRKLQGDADQMQRQGQQQYSAAAQAFTNRYGGGFGQGQQSGQFGTTPQSPGDAGMTGTPVQGQSIDPYAAAMEAAQLANNRFGPAEDRAKYGALQQMWMNRLGMEQKAKMAAADREANLQSQKDLHNFKINNPLPTTAARNFQMAQEGGYKGSFHDYTMANKRAAATTVNLGQTSEKEEQKHRGKLLVDQYAAISEAAGNAQQQNAYLEQAKSINDNPMGDGNDLPGPLKLKAGNIIVGLGFDPARIPGFETISDGQSFNGTIQNVVLSKMQAQKGPQTEGDAQRIADTVASLGNTPEARTFLLNSAISMNQMEILKQRHWQQHYRANNTYDGAAYSWSQGLGGQKFVGRNRVSGNVIFLPQFMERMQQEHPDASMEQILELWQSYD